MYARVNGMRLFFDIEGAGFVADGPVLRQKPTVVLLHGGPGLDHSMFKPAFSALAEIAQIVYFDMRGHGRSDRSTSDRWNLEQWADDLNELCDLLGLEDPILLGSSFGGYVALVHAVRYPGRAARIILVSTALRGTAHPVRRERMLEAFHRRGGVAACETARRLFDERSPAAFEQYRRVCGPLYTRRPPDPEAAARGINNQSELLQFFERKGGEGAVFDLESQLGVVTCPVLVMGGDDDPITPIAEQRTIAQALSAAPVRFHAFAGCGHGVWHDDRERAFELMTTFIEEA